MMYPGNDRAYFIIILFTIMMSVRAMFQDLQNIEHIASHLPETKFSFSDYSEYLDNDEGSRGPQASQGDQVPNRGVQLQNIKPLVTETLMRLPDRLSQNITWDPKWASNIKFGQISAVSIDPKGNIAVFHRGDRIWGYNSFDYENKFDLKEGPVKQNTIILLDKTGKEIVQWGRNMFYLPHGLTIDSLGNYWITDVAMHQVFKFDAKDIENNLDRLKKERFEPEIEITDIPNINDLFRNSIIKPSLILGEAFQPGNDVNRFCKPTAVAVQRNGDFFVSDGYCNSRIIKFNKEGERILHWGRGWQEDMELQALLPNVFSIPHALALAEELNYLFVADREDGRIVSFYSNNGSFHKVYKHPVVGSKIYGVAYARGRIYLINGPDIMKPNGAHIGGFIMDVNTGNVISQFKPGQDMNKPHDIAVTEDEREIYVVELDVHKMYKFVQDIDETRLSSKTQSVNSTFSSSHHEPAPLTDINSSDPPSGGTSATTLILSLITATVVLIVLCVAIAALVARWRKRGCLLTVRRRMHWEADRKENFKLSNLLDGRKGKGFKFMDKRPSRRDFSKLNTEPETSEDEHPENSLTKII